MKLPNSYILQSSLAGMRCTVQICHHFTTKTE